jgi:hypothetical protein
MIEIYSQTIETKLRAWLNLFETSIGSSIGPSNYVNYFGNKVFLMDVKKIHFISYVYFERLRLPPPKQLNEINF